MKAIREGDVVVLMMSRSEGADLADYIAAFTEDDLRESETFPEDADAHAVDDVAYQVFAHLRDVTER